MEDSCKSREHGVSLLLHRRKITADATKSGDPSRTAKDARISKYRATHCRHSSAAAAMLTSKSWSSTAPVQKRTCNLATGSVINRYLTVLTFLPNRPLYLLPNVH